MLLQSQGRVLTAVQLPLQLFKPSWSLTYVKNIPFQFLRLTSPFVAVLNQSGPLTPTFYPVSKLFTPRNDIRNFLKLHGAQSAKLVRLQADPAAGADPPELDT